MSETKRAGARPQTITVIGGSDGTNVYELKVGTDGTLYTDGTGAANTATPGSAVPAKAMQVSGTDGTNARVLKTDTTGVALVDGTAADGFLGGDGTKNVTTAGTRVPLATTTAIKWVVVTARPANTGKIVVGTVTCVAAAGSERGVVLSAGQAVTLPASNLSGVYIDATVNGEGVAFAYGS